MTEIFDPRTLGRSGLTVSRICFGSLTMAPLQGNFPVERAAEVMAYAFSQGITFVDCAQLYRVYPQVAAALRKTTRDIVIASKSYAYTAEMAVESVDEARRELGRDVIDIFMLHEQESEHTLRGHKEALDMLYTLKSRGVIRAVGISTHHVAGVRAAIDAGLDVLHPLINVAGWGIVDGTREEMEDAIASAAASGIGIYAMKAFGGGNLFQKPRECLSYVRTLPGLDAVALGMQSELEVDANIRFFTEGDFSSAQTEALSHRERRLHIEEWCTGCGACVARCGQKAARIVDGRMVPDRAICVLCGYCGTVCDQYAIKVL